MRFLVFATFTIVVVLATAVGSYVAGASFGTIALRVIIALVVLQVAYFAYLMIAAYAPKDKPLASQRNAKKDRAISNSQDTAVDSPKN